jgi:hypothetical protein
MSLGFFSSVVPCSRVLYNVIRIRIRIRIRINRDDDDEAKITRTHRSIVINGITKCQRYAYVAELG